MNCIVIAKLIGVLYFNNVDVYKIDCSYSEHFVIIEDDEFKEVEILNINNDLSYNIKEI